MGVFAVISLEEPGDQYDLWSDRINMDLDEICDSVLTFPPVTWFVAFDGTTSELFQELNKKLKNELENNYLLGALPPSTVVIPVNNYAGYATSDLWEWLVHYGGFTNVQK